MNGKRQQWFFALLFFVLALLSKATASVIPVVLLLADKLVYHRSIDFKNMLEKAPFFLFSLAVGLLAIYGQESCGAFVENIPISDKFLLGINGLALYVLKFLFHLDCQHTILFPLFTVMRN